MVLLLTGDNKSMNCGGCGSEREGQAARSTTILYKVKFN